MQAAVGKQESRQYVWGASSGCCLKGSQRDLNLAPEDEGSHVQGSKSSSKKLRRTPC